MKICTIEQNDLCARNVEQNEQLARILLGRIDEQNQLLNENHLKCMELMDYYDYDQEALTELIKERVELQDGLDLCERTVNYLLNGDE